MKLQTFHFAPDMPLRVIERDGEPWFIAADVCKALDIGNPSDALSRLDDDEKMTLGSTEGHSGQRGGAQSYNVVNESGLYSLILGSRKPEARKFKKWVTAKVLPAIRKRGFYADPGAAVPGDALSGLAGAVGTLAEQMTQLAAHVGEIADEQRLAQLRERDTRGAFTTTIDKIVRIVGAQRRNEQLDPNRPLDDSDIARLSYLLSIGASAKEVARRLHRTHAVIRHFIDTNPELVLRALQQPLL